MCKPEGVSIYFSQLLQQLTVSRFHHFRATKDFTIETSLDGISYETALEATFEDPLQLDCSDVLVETFSIGKVARILRVTLVNYYGSRGIGLEYFNVIHGAHNA